MGVSRSKPNAAANKNIEPARDRALTTALAEIEKSYGKGAIMRMGDESLIREIRETRPDLPVICISGYAEEAFRNSLGESTDIHFLPKPFSLAQLAGKVKEVMTG